MSFREWEMKEYTKSNLFFWLGIVMMILLLPSIIYGYMHGNFGSASCDLGFILSFVLQEFIGMKTEWSKKLRDAHGRIITFVSTNTFLTINIVRTLMIMNS